MAKKYADQVGSRKFGSMGENGAVESVVDRVIYKVVGADGIDIHPFSYDRNKQEVLYGRFAKFQVTHIEDITENHQVIKYITLEEL